MDIGTRLKQAREQQGKSVRDIAQATKLSRITIDALEANDFTRLPGGIFARACVRACAREVGLEPEAVVKAFVEQCPSAARETIDDLAARSQGSGVPSLRWLTVALVLTLLAASAVGAYYWYDTRVAGPRTSIDRGAR
jgi:cytoskeletal protein RodZ